MPCYHPLKAYMSADPKDRRIKFTPHDGYIDRPIEVPCGKCIGCRKAKSQSWAIRCMHESELYDSNCVVTLTYDDVSMPSDFSVKKIEVSSFMKHLRKKIYPIKVRFFACGEYGDRNFRPHYHIILFNYDFKDKRLYSISDKGSRQYRSDFLESIWRKGFSTIGDLTPASARYIAGYLQKKVQVGDRAGLRFIPLLGGYFVEQEFGLMSRRPGIGSNWFDKFETDCKKDYLYIDGVKVGVPRYYRDKMKKTDLGTYEKNRIGRRKFASNNVDDYKVQERKEHYFNEIAKLRGGNLNA